jgi:cardiolipin synthase C
MHRIFLHLSLLLLLPPLAAHSSTVDPIQPYLVTSDAMHQVRIIDDEVSALENILQMIDRAEKTIEVEFFIFSADKSGSLVLQSLAKKAHEGVHIRILLDYFSQRGKPGLDEFYQAELAARGIETRYFNIASMFEFWKAGFRNHRKFLIIDGKEAATGGRNISDEYFGLRERMNYLDRDIWIKGPIVSAIRESFEKFWHDPLVEKLNDPQPPRFESRAHPLSSRAAVTLQDYESYRFRLRKFQQRVEKTKNTFVSKPSDLELRSKVEQIGEAALEKSPVLTIPSVTFVSDSPSPGRLNRIFTPYLYRKLGHTKGSLLIENFTFLVKGEQKETFLRLLGEDIQSELLTNSFYSEPNFVLAELSHSRQHMAVRRGMKVYSYSARRPSDHHFISEEGKNSKWGLHTKSLVIDNRDSLIMTYNLDPRSTWINVENAICINDSPEFAAILEQCIRERIKDSYLMDENGKYVNGPEYHGWGRIIMILFRPLGELFSDQL